MVVGYSKKLFLKIKILSQYSTFSTGQAVLLDYKELHGLHFKRIRKNNNWHESIMRKWLKKVQLLQTNSIQKSARRKNYFTHK
jgi:hypothetical protein